MEIISEIYKILFIASIVFTVYVFGNFIVKFYGRTKFGHSTRIILSTAERIILWLSITLIFSYIF
jgi:hypothetical protein